MGGGPRAWLVAALVAAPAAAAADTALSPRARDRVHAQGPEAALAALRTEAARCDAGALAFELGRIEEGVAAWERCAEQHPHDRELRRELAARYVWVGRNTEALALYRELVRESPGDLELQARLGEVASWAGESQLAREALEGVLARNPAHPRALRAEGYRRLWAGDALGAERLLERYLENRPEDAEARVTLGRLRAARRVRGAAAGRWSRDSESRRHRHVEAHARRGIAPGRWVEIGGGYADAEAKRGTGSGDAHYTFGRLRVSQTRRDGVRLEAFADLAVDADGLAHPGGGLALTHAPLENVSVEWLLDRTRLRSSPRAIDERVMRDRARVGGWVGLAPRADAWAHLELLHTTNGNHGVAVYAEGNGLTDWQGFAAFRARAGGFLLTGYSHYSDVYADADPFYTPDRLFYLGAGARADLERDGFGLRGRVWRTLDNDQGGAWSYDLSAELDRGDRVRGRLGLARRGSDVYRSTTFEARFEIRF